MSRVESVTLVLPSTPTPDPTSRIFPKGLSRCRLSPESRLHVPVTPVAPTLHPGLLGPISGTARLRSSVSLDRRVSVGDPYQTRAYGSPSGHTLVDPLGRACTEGEPGVGVGLERR